MQSVCHLAAPRGHWICIWDAAQQQKYAASVDERLHTHAHCLQPSLFAYWLWSCVVTVLILLTKYWRPRDVTLLNYFLKPRGITSACWKCSTDGRSISLAATIRPPPTLPLPTPEVDPHKQPIPKWLFQVHWWFIATVSPIFFVWTGTCVMDNLKPIWRVVTKPRCSEAIKSQMSTTNRDWKQCPHKIDTPNFFGFGWGWQKIREFWGKKKQKKWGNCLEAPLFPFAPPAVPRAHFF